MAQSVRLERSFNPVSPIDMPALILAGGLGSRLRGVVDDRPKVLAPVRDYPFLTYLLDWLERSGWHNVILCTGYLGEKIEIAYGSSFRTLSLSYSVESHPLGTAGALRLALNQFSNDQCLVLNGDSYMDVDLRTFLDWHNQHGFSGSMLLTQVDDVSRFGSVQCDEHRAVRAFHEKQEVKGQGFINAGVYILPRKWLETIPSGQTVSIERDCFPIWLNQGLGGYQAEGRFIDIGTPESLEQAETFFADYTLNAGI